VTFSPNLISTPECLTASPNRSDKLCKPPFNPYILHPSLLFPNSPIALHSSFTSLFSSLTSLFHPRLIIPRRTDPYSLSPSYTPPITALAESWVEEDA